MTGPPQPFPLGSVVRLASGGFAMTVIMHSEQPVGDKVEPLVHCCWHCGNGHAMAAAYPAYVLRQEQ